MRLSAFTAVTKPEERQDIWRESLSSALAWTDILVVVCGHKDDQDLILTWVEENYPDRLGDVVTPYLEWPEEWHWSELALHLNWALPYCQGEWAIRFDIDYVFADDIGDELRMMLTYGEHKVCTFQKMSAVLAHRFYEKGGVQLAINLKSKNVLFGKTDKYTDLCVPIQWDGESRDVFGVPVGRLLTDEEVGRTRQYFYNYDYTFKTKDFTIKEFARFARAHKRYFGSTKWGQNEKQSIDKFIHMMKERLRIRCIYKKGREDQPSFIREKLKNITPEQFGYSGWGQLAEEEAKRCLAEGIEKANAGDGT